MSRKPTKPTHQIRRELKERRERMELRRDGWIDLVSVYVPLTAPAVPAALTWAAIVEHYPGLLHVPTWAAILIGLVAALAVESLGVLSVETALAMWQWNQDQDHERAPLWLAISAAAVYLVTVILLVVMLKMRPDWALLSLIPLSTLGIIASVIAVSRKQHGERIYRAEVAHEEAAEVAGLNAQIRTLQAENRRLQAQALTPSNVASNGVEEAQQTKLDAANRARTKSKAQAIEEMIAHFATDPNASYSEVGRAIGRSKATIGAYLDELEAAGHVHRNGNGVEILNAG